MIAATQFKFPVEIIGQGLDKIEILFYIYLGRGKAHALSELSCIVGRLDDARCLKKILSCLVSGFQIVSSLFRRTITRWSSLHPPPPPDPWLPYARVPCPPVPVLPSLLSSLTFVPPSFRGTNIFITPPPCPPRPYPPRPGPAVPSRYLPGSGLSPAGPPPH
jgi:hypothetical protein